MMPVRPPPDHPRNGDAEVLIDGEARVKQQHTMSNAEYSSARGGTLLVATACLSTRAGHAYQVVCNIAGSVCLRFLASKWHTGCRVPCILFRP
jgi:hypothetical protein